MQIHGNPVCVAEVKDLCGEGAVWHAAEGVLYWTDINRFLIHSYDPADGRVQTWKFQEPVTALTLTDRPDTLAVVLGSKVILWEPASNRSRDTAFHLKEWPALRLNDARADSRGSLWLGSMGNNLKPDGSSCQATGSNGVLYRFDPDGAIREWKQHVGISNTVAWSPDQKSFYFADSTANVLWVYDYDNATGQISRERPFLTGFHRGVPDGSAVDEKGFLWNCRFGGGCIVRVAPDGRIDTIVEMPVTNITTCTFGGDDLNTLYVTTAAVDAPANEKLAGNLFAIQTEVRGQAENQFRIFGSR